MTYAGFQRLISALVLAGGLGLLAIATSAARHGVWSAAGFIGACGLALVGAVAWSVCARRLGNVSPA